MKKLLMILTCVLFTISCEKEGEIELTNSDIVGKWNVTKMTVFDETTDIPSGLITVDLKSDGKYYVNFFDDTYTGTYTIEGSTVIGISGSVTEYFKFTSLSGNKAKIDYSNTEGEIYKFEAVKI